MVERRNPACLVTAPPLQERRSVTNHGIAVEEERQYATDAEVIRHWALNLYTAQDRFTKGEGDIFAILGPLGVLQRFGCPVSDCNTIIRAASRGLPFPFHIFRDQAA